MGQDFRFGRGGAGSVALLRAAADAGRFALELVPSVCIDDIARELERRARGAGRAAISRAARDLLGRPYSMRGRVVAGEKLGRRLGYPTANIRMRRRKLPLTGIYAVRVRGVDAVHPHARAPGWRASGSGPRWTAPSRCSKCMCSISPAALYGRELEVEFVAKIRDEEKFASLDALVQQMHQDAAAGARAA